MVPQRIVWHHSAVAKPEHQFNDINNYHRSRGFPVSSLGLYVGYHWLVEADGSVHQARREDEIGAHDTGENLNSIGICLAGNFNMFPPAEPQIAAAARLVGEIRARWKIPLARIEPHRWDDETDCPGTHLADNWLPREYLKRSNVPLLRFVVWLDDTFHIL